MRSTDAEVFAAYRNDPEVARHQLWDLPFTEQDAHGVLDDQDELTDLVIGGWTQLAVEQDGEVIGDVCCNIDETGGIAEIGEQAEALFSRRAIAMARCVDEGHTAEED